MISHSSELRPVMNMATAVVSVERADCGVLSYAMVGWRFHADKVVAITDCLVPFPNFPAHISMTKVDYVVVVDADR